MKRIIEDTINTRCFKDADKRNVYVAMLDGRQALLVTNVWPGNRYTSTTFSAHTTRKVAVDVKAVPLLLTELLDDYIKTGYEVYEFDSIAEALDYIAKNI